MAYAYAHLYQLPCTGLRFFTVYGPWGRPDMAYFKFTRAILEGKPIELFDPKKTGRDFTYIDDIVEGVIGALSHAQPPKQGSAPFQIFNLGNDQPVILETMVTLLEKLLGKEALKKMAPLPPGDVPLTHADISESKACFGFEPKTSLEDGLKKFVKWYFDFYG